MRRPDAQPNMPNGDLVRKGSTAVPDTVTSAPPPRGFRDKAVVTDPSSPRTRDTQQRVQAPLLTQSQSVARAVHHPSTIHPHHNGST